MEVYQKALENDHEYQAAIANYRANKEARAISRSSLLPNVNAGARWNESSSEGESFRRSVLGNNPESTSDSESTSFSKSIELRQTLFNLEQWYSFRGASVGADASAAVLRTEEQELILRAAEAYFNALEAVETLESAKAEENALKHQLEQTKQRFEVGLIAITGVHEAQAAFDNAVANRLIAAGQLGIAFEAISVLTGDEVVSLHPLQTAFPVALPAPQNREEWVKMATERNTQLTNAKLSAESRKLAAKASKAAHLPTVSGTLGYSQSDNENFNDGILVNSSDTDGSSITVNLNIPLFSGGRTSAIRRRDHQAYIRARENYLLTKRNIIQQARSTHLNVVTGVSTVKARKQATVSNRSALEATQAGYDVGTRDLVDVLNAQQAVYRSQRNYYDALYTYVLNTLRLKQVAGTLSVEDVKALNAWLDKDKRLTAQY